VFLPDDIERMFGGLGFTASMWLSYALSARTFVSMEWGVHSFIRARYTEEEEEQKKSAGFFSCCFPTPVVARDMSYGGFQGADLNSWFNLKLAKARVALAVVPAPKGHGTKLSSFTLQIRWRWNNGRVNSGHLWPSSRFRVPCSSSN
jgi:hypothetical protein